ncbi:isochorismatase family protein [Xanthobacter dioxanivorans]|uniref:Isochorismatase family protein n=1 Tax=Xanthobacter dioxanivorans TaxID=2528964 RepID=A0A974PM60_9HYPH|nr:isochorismatase family protein [Xanthobacter dioxanivorans]QRG05734.1 isochorismatase family protein [Xanthobacter dioxanivorans]
MNAPSAIAAQPPAPGLPRIAPYALPQAADLPQARAGWRLERDRAALLVHDMQLYFARPYAPDASPLAPMVANIARLVAHCRAAGIPVFYTAQEVRQDRRDRGLQADLWGPGMSDPLEHQPLLRQLTPQAGDFVLVKHRYSAFQRSNLEALIRARGRDQLVVCGVYAHIGCLLTAAEAFMRDIQPFLAADALADFSREKHDMALAYVADVCGVPLVTDQIVAAL